MTRTRPSTGFALLALLVLVATVYAPGLGGGYVFDDYPNIVENAALHVHFGAGWQAWLAAIFSSPSSQLQRPLAMLTFALNHAATGLDPRWMKATNIGIHLANTLLVFALARQLLHLAHPGNEHRNRIAALWISAAWALNPINLMAVLFVVQRMESLSHTFVFAGLWLYLAGRERLRTQGHGWPLLLTGIVGGTTLGALVKESAVLLPVYALTIEWALLGFATKNQARDRKLLVLYGVVLVAPAIAGMAWLLPGLLSGHAYAGRDFSLGERLLTEGRVVLDYLRWVLLPDLGQLSLYHDDYPLSHSLLSPPSTLLALAGLTTLAMLAWWLRRRRPLTTLGIVWFLAAHTLTATVIPLELMYEHRNYFAALGVCLALGDLLLVAPSIRLRVGGTIAIGLLALYTGLTALRAYEWRDPIHFAAAEAEKHSQSPRATYDLARNLIFLSDFRANSPVVDRAFAALDRAMAAGGASPLSESAAIILAARTGREIQPQWWYQLQEKLRNHANGPQQNNALAGLVRCQIHGRCNLPREPMLDSFAAAMHQRQTPETLHIYGDYALNILRDPSLAMQAWQQAVELEPGTAQYQVTLVRMLIASGQLEEAAWRIDNMRRIGRLGQNEQRASKLEELLEQARKDQPPKSSVSTTLPARTTTEPAPTK